MTTVETSARQRDEAAAAASVARRLCRPTDRVRVGLIAPEFPPDIGGMHVLAAGLAASLGRIADVVVYAPSDNTNACSTFRIRTVDFDRFRMLANVLRRDACEAYVALNAGLLPLAERLSAPFFAYFHGNDFLKPWLRCGPPWLEALQRPYLPIVRHALRRAALRRASGQIAHAFTNSRNTQSLVCTQLGLPQECVLVVPPAVDEAFFARPLGELRCSGDPLRLLTVTRLTRYSARKNVDGVLHALASLQGRVPFHYTVVGDGDDRPRLQALTESLGLRDYVRFTGRLTADQLVDAYRDCDAFILAARASEDDVEGFGIVYMEASACGKPVICSRDGGATDAVEEGVNGIVLSSSSSADIAAGIRYMDANLASFAPERVREWASQYRWDGVAHLIRDRIEATIPRVRDVPLADRC